MSKRRPTLRSDAQGVTYVMTNEPFKSVKVGYTHAGSDRLRTLRKLGWRDFGVLVVATHRLARDIEQAALLEIRCRHFAPVHLTPELMPAGWTETVSANLLPPLAVWDIVCEQAALIQLAPSVSRPSDGRRRNGGTPPRRRPGDSSPYSRLARTQARLERLPEKKD
ncbi:hypothetical protein ACF1AL_14800 [Streptomyces sp. NPDC014801]|uniref:hypothetical protein n=1 Tax=Streptomyces sp. NPDC014801 TaxID=3364916 RepID=UPI0036F5E260